MTGDRLVLTCRETDFQSPGPVKTVTDGDRA